MKRSRARSRTGFTVVEALVILALIAILAAVLYPHLAAARESAGRTVCPANLRQLGSAFAMYRRDYDGFYPFGGWYGARGGDVDTDRSNDWHISMFPYIRDPGLYLCPASADAHTNPSDWNRTSCDYLYNNFLAEGRQPLHEGAVVAPRDCINLIEGHSDWGRGPCRHPFSGGVMVGNDIWCTEYTLFGRNASLVTGGLWGNGTRIWGLPRHHGGGNVLFADGHVRSFTGWTATGAAETRRIFQGQLPWTRHGDPTQKRGGSWDAVF